MSTSPIPSVYPSSRGATVSNPLPAPSPVIRRRSSPQQGFAIQILGNAVDHLLRSRMFLIDEPPSKADADAIHLLMRLKRAVFSECEQVTEANRSLRQWMARTLTRSAN
ncbi:hypothetical protein EDE15_0055 [Edaphobacter aggregans]|uniref:Uncharacterized protein n=1 Tax=Edaphobacter aggregans TaxID=570835 RepID=A0A3R9QZW9_9BACT|nr:hypothetical protein [Edaphobacter aggregans]RSL14603.1 hypothetical protein EDE15_0055 [Edaphobacter aggregans]